MTGPLISCVMPTYGRPDFVNESAAMFLAQDYPNKELLIFNDCPGQKFVCDLPGVRVINVETRFANLGEKRNAAIEQARGEWIAVWDDDDIYLPWRLSLSMKRSLELQTPLYCPAEYWAYWGEEPLHDNQARLDWIYHPLVLFHREVWEETGGYPAQTAGEDTVFIRKVLVGRSLEWKGDDMARFDRMMILRGKSRYQHTSINGGQQPPNISPGEIVIEPCPIQDPALRAAQARLIQIRTHHQQALGGSRRIFLTNGSDKDSDRVDLDDLPEKRASVGYGSLGLHGDLGYEGKRVQVAGRTFEHALSTHGPARVVYSLEGELETFQCRVAINDDVAPGMSSASFLIFADGKLAGAAPNIVAGDDPRLMTIDVSGVSELTLVVQHGRWDCCHAVWIEPRLTRAGTIRRPRTIIDGLQRAEITVPPDLPDAELCFAAVASSGYETWLEDLLESIRANAQCPDALFAIFLLDESEACRRIAEKHRAIVLPCRALRPVNVASKAILYSAGRAIKASRFLCFDLDMLVLNDLRPIVASLDAMPPGSILACREGNWAGSLGEALQSLYWGKPDDWRLGERPYRRAMDSRFVVNDGLFAGTRAALCQLDDAIRDMPEAINWLDDPKVNAPWRNQFLFNLALAKNRCGLELDPIYNLQLHQDSVDFEDSPTGLTAMTGGRQVAVLHFNGWGRTQYEAERQRLRRRYSNPVGRGPSSQVHGNADVVIATS